MNMIQLFPQSPNPKHHAEAASASSAPEPEGQAELVLDDVMEVVGGEHRPATAERPWLYTNMIASTDGATAIDGLSGELGSDGDLAMFQALRAQADVILVGAATARAEEYRPPIAYSSSLEQREKRGQKPRPRLALVSNSLHIESNLPLFDDTEDNRPMIITSENSLATATDDPDRRWLLERADVRVAGVDQVDLLAAVTLLGESGHPRILCEGGPSINGQLAALGRVDEWNLTIAPILASGESKRAAVGPLPESPPAGMELARVWLQDHFLFCRWVASNQD